MDRSTDTAEMMKAFRQGRVANMQGISVAAATRYRQVGTPLLLHEIVKDLMGDLSAQFSGV